MATDTPPPYFPQGSLAPPDESRYRKFKVAIFVLVLLILTLLTALGVGLWYVVKWLS